MTDEQNFSGASIDPEALDILSEDHDGQDGEGSDVSAHGEEDYQVGYGKPPRTYQFQKGFSGNPSGRPKNKKNLSTRFNAIASQSINVTENGIVRSMPMIDAVIWRVFHLALAGNGAATREVLNMHRGSDIHQSNDEGDAPVDEQDVFLLEDLVRQMEELRAEENAGVEAPVVDS